MFNSGVTRFIENDKPILYGTDSSDTLSADVELFTTNATQYPTLISRRDNGAIIIGADGNDNLTGTFVDDAVDEIYGGDGDDTLAGVIGDDELFGEIGNDILRGGIGEDKLDGGDGNDNLNGGRGEDAAVYFDSYTDSNGNLNYDITTDSNTKITTITHLNGGIDGTDTLKNVEFGIFGGKQVDLGTLVASSDLVGIPIATAPRLIPLPLTDGIETTKYVEVAGTIANPNPNDPPTPPTISLTAPVAMLDGDIDYTLNILPYEPDTEYNVVYVIDTSISIDAVELQTIQDAYTELTNFYINEGIAENINFGVVSFDVNHSY